MEQETRLKISRALMGNQNAKKPHHRAPGTDHLVYEVKSVRVDVKEWATAEEVAKALGITMSEHVRRLVAADNTRRLEQ